MPHFTTPHYRLFNMAGALLLLLAGLNAQVLDSPFLPTYKVHLLLAAFAIVAAILVFVRPTPEVGPLKGPHLSLVQMRIVIGALFLACMLSLVNYYFLDPGLFAPYKKQVSVAAFALSWLFFVLYSSQLVELMERDRGAGDA